MPSYANRSVRGVEWKTLVCHASDHLVRFSPTTFARSLRAIAYFEVYLVRVIAIDEGSYAALFSCRDRRNVSAKSVDTLRKAFCDGVEFVSLHSVGIRPDLYHSVRYAIARFARISRVSVIIPSVDAIVEVPSSLLPYIFLLDFQFT